MTGILDVVNQTPIIEWYCKKQATIATARYSLEFIAVQSMTMTDLIIDLLYTLHMMVVPLDYHSYALGVNCTIIPQSNIPKSNLMKHWMY